jgi:hypothetical protein
MWWRCLLVAILVLASLWFANLAVGNWWAGGGPPTPQPAKDRFVFCGNVSFGISCLLFVSAIAVGINIYRMKKRTR